MENMANMKSLASSLIQIGQGVLTLKQLRTMKVPVLAIASTALLAGIAYRALKSPGAANDKDGGKKAPARIPSGKAADLGQSAKVVADKAMAAEKEIAARIKKEYTKYKKSSGVKMRSYDKMAADLKGKLAEAGAEVKDKYKDILGDADKRSKDLKKRMLSFKAEGKKEWDGFKKDFTRDLESLGKDLKGIALS